MEEIKQLMLPRHYLTLCVFAFLLSPMAVFGQEEPAGLSIIVQAEKTYDGDIFGFRQKVLVEGLVNGDVGNFGSDVHIKGKVTGNINVVNGSVVLYHGAEVVGNLVCLGGSVQINDEATLGGKRIHYFDPGEDRTLRVGGVKADIAFFFAMTMCLFLLAIGFFYAFPNQINEASFHLSQDVVRALTFGSVALALFLIGLFASFLLMTVIIGFPLFLLLVAVFVVLNCFGIVVICHRLAVLAERWSGTRLKLVGGFLAASLILILLLHMPIIDWLVVLGVIILGTGAAIETRFGTNKQWFTRKKRYW